MKDIAKDLGLSIVTISKVLRNQPDIAQKTRERVLRRAKELDYQPNLMARSLVTGRSYLIGLIVPDLLHPFFAEVAKSMSANIGRAGYSLMIASSEENPEIEAREIERLLGRRLDALVIASSDYDLTSFKRMDRHGTPYVLIDRQFPGLKANFVGTNDQLAGSIATEHLLDQGCRRVAHIRGRDNSTGLCRFAGYKAALARRGMPYLKELVITRQNVDVNSVQHGVDAMRLLLDQRPIPDGVFAYNDPLAIGAMNAILDAGLRIPEDVAVVGCGNLHYDSSLRVPLTSVDQHSALLGERTAEILLRLLQSKKQPPPTSAILDPSLVLRSSSRRQAPASGLDAAAGPSAKPGRPGKAPGKTSAKTSRSRT